MDFQSRGAKNSGKKGFATTVMKSILWVIAMNGHNCPWLKIHPSSMKKILKKAYKE